MKKLIIVLILCASAAVWAAEDYYSFTNDSQRQQFETLTSNLRCLVCQNQTIAESNAGLASDLRNQIYRQIQQGKSTDEIISFLVGRYGDYILYRPPFRSNTILLWALPFALLLTGIGYLIFYIRRERPVC